ncbi:MAG TPA: nucleoside hydrolase [Gemmatimonadaceae bacterium]|nr:nucleoside hydrolase [Gemmatimonadaceae bacterium]
MRLPGLSFCFAVLFVVSTGVKSGAQTADARIPVVLSTDVGNEIDDQWAITYLLLQPRFEVLGVMSVHAPSISAPAGQTSYRILVDVVENRLAMSTHPPLVEGGSLPMQDAKTPRTSPAVRFLIETSRRFTRDNRLTVLMIGAATDVASAILTDPTIVDRVRVVQMGFPDEKGGEEFNIANDVHAVQAILDSKVPLVIGPGNVCRASLSLTLDQARAMLATRGAIGAWLWEEYQAWYYRAVKPLRVDDFSKPWVIWDDIALAYVLGMTRQHTLPRPSMRDDMTFAPVNPDQTITWITDVDEERMWADFLSLVDAYQRAHAVSRKMYGRLTFMMP